MQLVRGGALAMASIMVTSVFAMSASAATPRQPATPIVEEIAQGSQSDQIRLRVAGPVQVNFRKITLPANAGTGKHCHHGQLVAVVQQGVLTHYAPVYPGGVHRYSTGESIVEGSGYVHEGRNEGTEDVILWVTYLTPQGKPLAETDLSRCKRQR